jgi:hypothetical protein
MINVIICTKDIDMLRYRDTYITYMEDGRWKMEDKYLNI